MGWGEAMGPKCGCEGCSRPTLNSLHAEVVALTAALAEERERADVMAPIARASHGKSICPDPPACHIWLALAAHDAAREAARWTPGTRVRMNEKNPWPERVGCEGVVVAPSPDGLYPQASPGYALVRLDDDPLGCRPVRTGPRERWWTCQTSLACLDVVEAG